MCASVVPADAQPKNKKSDKNDTAQPTVVDPKADKADKDAKKPTTTKPPATRDFNFSGLDLNGRMRTPQLLYFLERANEELERASLEKRSFIPHMVRTVEEEAL